MILTIMAIGLVRPSGWEPAPLVLTISVTVQKLLLV